MFLSVQYSGLGGQAPRRLGQAPSDVTPEAIVNRLAGGPQAHGFPGLDIHSDPQFQEFNRIYNEQVLLRSWSRTVSTHADEMPAGLAGPVCLASCAHDGHNAAILFSVRCLPVRLAATSTYGKTLHTMVWENTQAADKDPLARCVGGECTGRAAAPLRAQGPHARSARICATRPGATLNAAHLHAHWPHAAPLPATARSACTGAVHAR